jgi:hypothetical protein
METTAKKPAGRIATLSIVAAVLVGAVAIMGVSDLSGKGILAKAFVLFVSTIIAVQVVPGLMLLSAMVKSVCGLGAKTAASAAAK